LLLFEKFWETVRFAIAINQRNVSELLQVDIDNACDAWYSFEENHYEEVNFEDICSSVTRNGMRCSFARFLRRLHQCGTLYIYPHALQKPSQSVCAFGLTSWGFMVNFEDIVRRP
ncbi:hypothetical protein, partial [uncultured Selenomonas sp.]|uniref:hypothetical protein n=1 Tax=uncultured Selenomonas sp. TaxID=159275 RepID=UPI002604FF46